MNKVKNIFWIVVGFGIIGFAIYKIARNVIIDHVLSSNYQIAKAVIINEKNYMGNQPVDPKFSYSYSFIIDKKIYTGDSHDITLRIGDTIEIKYDKNRPSLNRPLYPKE